MAHPAPIEPSEAQFELLQWRYGIVGRSPALRRAMELLLQAAPTELTVLITGETGTGKELFARAIHGLSPRRRYPFVVLNCAAIPETLLESELFGHVRGAFTGAVTDRQGYFEIANRGTLFLDEIGELPPTLQVKLLRVLETGEFSPLGSTEVRHTDVRLIAATNRDLERAVEEGTFRQDLFFRLNAVRIHLPPLRERPEDIPLLVEYIATRTCERLGIEFEGITLEALQLLQQYHWPGNVRQLRNLVETMVTLEHGRLITPELVRKYLPEERPTEAAMPVPVQRAIVALPRPTAPLAGFDTGLLYRVLLDIRSELSELRRAVALLAPTLELLEQKLERFEQHLHSSDSDEHTIRLRDEADFRLQELERRLILAALKRFGGNRRRAARALGISERTLYRKLSEYGLGEML